MGMPGSRYPLRMTHLSDSRLQDIHANWSTSSTVITQELAPLSQYVKLMKDSRLT